jgi:competence protein ComEA
LVIYFYKRRSYNALSMAARSLAGRLFLSAAIVLSIGLPHSLAKKKPPLRPVNINTANSEELQQVPGIGPATAQKILQMRKSYGPFKSVDDLLAIRGLGEKRLDKMRKYLTVGKPASSGNPASPTKPASPPKTLPTRTPTFKLVTAYDPMLHQAA